VELHAFPQLEFPREIVDRPPRFRERGLKPPARVPSHQCFEDVVADVVVGRQVVKMRIDRSDVGAERDVDVGRVQRLYGERERDEQRGKQSHHDEPPLDLRSQHTAQKCGHAMLTRL
jgi:hypothetical protein